MYFTISIYFNLFVTIFLIYGIIKQRKELKNLKEQREKLYKEIQNLTEKNKEIPFQSSFLLPEELQEFEKMTEITKTEIMESSLEMTEIFKKILRNLQYRILSSSVKVKSLNELIYRDWSLDLIKTIIEWLNQIKEDKEKMLSMKLTREIERNKNKE